VVLAHVFAHIGRDHADGTVSAQRSLFAFMQIGHLSEQHEVSTDIRFCLESFGPYRHVRV
jgi:hypothetical protein